MKKYNVLRIFIFFVFFYFTNLIYASDISSSDNLKSFMSLLSDENLKREYEEERAKVATIEEAVKEADKNKTPKMKEKIPASDMKSFSPPEESGENYKGYTLDILLDKLEHGDKIEQRKAANELWAQYGNEIDRLNQDAFTRIDQVVEHYLNTKRETFTESFSQVGRLWYLALPTLLKEIPLMKTSREKEMILTAYINFMKTPEIIDQLIALSNEAEEKSDIQNYLTILNSMKFTLPLPARNRPQITKEEGERLYEEKIIPQIENLNKKLKE